MNQMYRDLPLPPRGSHVRNAPTLPRDLALSLTLTPDRARLMFSARSAMGPAVYRGRGYFTERPDDMPGAGFRIPALSLLDPFLWQYRTVSPQHYKIVLRVIIPKLQKEGLPLTCALTMTDDPPLHIDVARADDGAFRVTLTALVPRDTLRALSTVDGYMLAEYTLYRIWPGHLKELEDFPDGTFTLSANDRRAAALGKLCDRASYLFSGNALPALRALGRGLPRPQSAPRPSAIPRDFPLPARILPPPVRVIELPGPCLVRAEVLPSTLPGTTRGAAFLADARRFRDYAGFPAAPIPLKAVKPTYSDLSGLQKAWYFHWRNRFRMGDVLKADAGYVYLLAYELLNSITAQGAEALAALLRLWEHFRADIPYLDRCMPGWCADYMLLNNLGSDFDALQERIPFDVSQTDLPAEVWYNRRLRGGAAALPFPILCGMLGSKLHTSRFCTGGHEKLCHEAMLTALRITEDHLAKTAPVTLLSPGETRTAVHESFYGAIVGRASSRRIILTYKTLTRDRKTQALVNNVLKCTENLLRRRERFPGRLKYDTLPDGLEAALTAAFGTARPAPESPAPVREPVRIDLDRARELEAASWENTRRLLDALDDDAEEDTRPETPASSEIPSFSVPSETSADLPDDKPVTLAEALSPLQTAVLAALKADDRAEIERLCAEEMTFPDAVYEEINEAALAILGDLVIDMTTGTLYEEYAASV